MTWQIPPYETQYNAATHTDVMDCECESFIHICEMLTNNKWRWSPRALAYLSHVTPQGSSDNAVMGAANQYGLISYSLWPTPDTFDWNSYYTPVPQNLLAGALKVQVKAIPPDLNKSPLWTILRFPDGTQHAVAQIDENNYFDSELGNPVKPLNYEGAVVINQVSLQLTLPTMPQIFTVNISGTEGIMLAAADMDEYQALCKVFGKDSTAAADKQATINP